MSLWSAHRRISWLLGLLLIGLAAVTQPSNKALADIGGTPVPASCHVVPRTVDEILELADPRAGIVLRQLPTGSPAETATREEIVAAVHELEACLNSGDELRLYALYSDSWIHRGIGDTDAIAMLKTYTPTPISVRSQSRYIGPWDISVLDDNRVMAALLLRSADELRPDPNRTRVVIFVFEAGRWLIDEEIEKVRVPGCKFPVEVAAVVGPPPGATFDLWPSSCVAQDDYETPED